ncbi:MAG: hypothetical protein M1837_003949 [Sclerophora amabilis]|nr:MAG: hypothetical protein M1837_003949 [Sclerophora amabilis]
MRTSVWVGILFAVASTGSSALPWPSDSSSLEPPSESRKVEAVQKRQSDFHTDETFLLSIRRDEEYVVSDRQRAAIRKFLIDGITALCSASDWNAEVGRHRERRGEIEPKEEGDQYMSVTIASLGRDDPGHVPTIAEIRWLMATALMGDSDANIEEYRGQDTYHLGLFNQEFEFAAKLMIDPIIKSSTSPPPKSPLRDSGHRLKSAPNKHQSGSLLSSTQRITRALSRTVKNRYCSLDAIKGSKKGSVTGRKSS